MIVKKKKKTWGLKLDKYCLDLCYQGQNWQEKIEKMDFMKFKNFCSSK